jgi:Flp pilus assembly protein TadD
MICTHKRWRIASYAAAFITATSFAPGGALAAGCTPPPQLEATLRAHPTAETYAALGDYFGDKNQHECAAQALAEAVKLDPHSAKFAYLLGLNLFVGGHAGPAVDALRQSIQLNPGSIQTHLLLASVLEQLHRQPEAQTQWRAALEIDPFSSLALDGLAKSLLASGDYPGVVQLLHPATPEAGETALTPDLALDLAIAYDHLGRLEDAAATLTAAAKAAPTSEPLANALALLDLRQGRHEEAAALLARQYVLHPEDFATQLDYFRVLAINDDHDRGLPLGKKLLARSPRDFNVLYFNGMLERQAGDLEAASLHLKQAAELNPTHANCRYLLGFSLARLNRPAEAKQQLEKALALGWTGPEIHFELAKADRALGDTEGAAREMAAYQQAERGKEQRTVALNKAAQADQEMRAGDFKSAIAHYREATEAWPSNPTLTSKLAAALDASGEHKSPATETPPPPQP